MRKAAVSCGIIGLILLIGGGLLAWWITPSYIARTPSDYNKTRTYTGTIKSLLNPAAVATGNFAAAIRTDLPATLTDNVKVQQTSGNSALLQDHRTISTTNTKIASMTWHYAVVRDTLQATTSHPSNWSVTPAKGLTVSWPFGAKKQTYTGWVPLTHTTVPLKYVTQTQQGGITTYEYHAAVPPTRITDSQALAGLPTSLPVALVPQLAAAGLITPSQVAGLSAAFPHATTLPLGYTYQASNNYFVDPSTGLVINVSNNESEVGGLALPTGTIIPILPVLAYTYHATSASVSQAATDANNGNSIITTLGVSLPITMAAVGFLLLLLAVFLWMRKRTRGRPVETTHPERHPSPAGRIS